MKKNLFLTNGKPLTAAAGLSLLGNGLQGTSMTDNHPENLLEQSRGSKPNIIFILADDMGYNDLSINGQTNFRTPSLDRTAREGMMLTSHYSGNTICAPSRAALLTGQHTGHVYQRGNGQIEFRPTLTILPSRRDSKRRVIIQP